MTDDEGTGRDPLREGRSPVRNGRVFDWVPIPYQSLDESGQIKRVNQAWLDTLGYERSAVEGNQFADFLSDQSRETFQAQFQTLLTRGRHSGTEFELRHAAGHLVPVAFEGAVEYGETKTVRRTHCQFFEIEQKAERNDRLYAQNAKIEALHDVAMDIEKETDEAAVYEALVNAAEEVLDFDIAIADAAEDGYLVTRAISKNVPESEYFERVPIADETKLGTHVYRTNETSLVRDLEDDDSSQVDHQFRSALTVPIGEHGVFQAVSHEPGAFDETDRDLAELLISHIRNALSRLDQLETLEQRTASLSRERNRLAAIFETVPEPVAHVRYEDRKPIVVAVNSAFEDTFGYDTDAIEGQSLNELIVPEERMETARELDRAAETADVVEREVSRVTTEGERTFRLRSSVLDTGGEPETLAIYVDLTDQKERERELERENERLEQFASIVSHDLRSPLTVASGRLELISEEHESPHIEEIRRAIERMDAIIDDVLTLTRKGQTVTSAEKEPVDLAELAETAWHAVDSADATLEAETTKTLHADRSRLRRVFENLFWNAVEHAGPTVIVTVGEMDDGFFVEDDGPGILESERERVFESGYTTTRDGTGLGLDIVEEIVGAHGWSVELRAAPNGGARFEVRTN